MTALRVVLVDDEPLVRADLRLLLEAEPDVVVAGEARNGIEALEQVDALRPDVLFLDVQMPDLDGLGVVAALDPATAPALIFVTAFDDYALQAFEAAAVDYLLKPFDVSGCRRALQRARQRLGSGGVPSRTADPAEPFRRSGSAGSQYLHRIAVRTAQRVLVVDVSDVHWIEATANYARLHFADRTLLARRTMRDLESLLDPAVFARVHRSAIVNVQRISSWEAQRDGDYELRTTSGATLTLSRSYRDAFLGRFGETM